MTAVARTRDDLARMRAKATQDGTVGPVAVVMTMGALHAGHVELIRQARQRSAVVVVTEFLNPLQFAPGEDLSKYPRTFDVDLELCRREGVDLVFAPGVDEVYPLGEPMVTVSAGAVGDVLEGRSRPGHFDGVLTVVAKLLHLIDPDLAFFGRKDAQQLWLIGRMVEDLDLPVEVVAVPTVRDESGLALSSRNTYLGPQDRHSALALWQALVRAQHLSGRTGPGEVVRAVSEILSAAPGVDTDYVALVDPATFTPVAEDHVGEAIVLVAARVGPTRLIDNTSVTFGGS
ncbi:MAG: pantoate--beta-alanine ligase [Actinomycetes bacterium]